MKINNLYKYNWHPLYKYIKQIMGEYFVCINEDYRTGIIDDIELERLYASVDFISWLNYIKKFYLNHNQSYIFSSVFDPLIINQYGDLVLFKYDSYTKLADKGYSFDTFFELYNGLYRECRSVVINIRTMEIILAPQAKFKNLNESDEWSEDKVLERIQNHSQYFITNKMDGSNQNFCYNSSDDKIYGSGSQSLDPKESWRLKKGWELFNSNPGYERLLREFPDTTFMFEFVSPDNPIVVHYSKEQEGLYLFGARDNLTGAEMSIPVLQGYANKYNVPMVDIYYSMDFEDILEQIDNNVYTCNEKEGWVISIYDENNLDNNKSVFKVKMKINDYVLMHKVITSLSSPNTLIEIISDGKFDDFFSKVPKAYKEIIKNLSDEIFRYVNRMEKLVLKEYCACMDKVNQDASKWVIDLPGLPVVNLNPNSSPGPTMFTSSESYWKLHKKVFMITAEEICTKDSIGYVRSIYLNSIVYKNSEYSLNVLHNGREIGKGRSYKKIADIRRLNEMLDKKE